VGGLPLLAAVHPVLVTNQRVAGFGWALVVVAIERACACRTARRSAVTATRWLRAGGHIAGPVTVGALPIRIQARPLGYESADPPLSRTIATH